MLDTKEKVNEAMVDQTGIRRRIVSAKYIPELGGGTTMKVDARVFHHAGSLHRDKNGNPSYDCWKDKEWVGDMKKRHPEIAVPMERSSNCVVTVPELPWKKK